MSVVIDKPNDNPVAQRHQWAVAFLDQHSAQHLDEEQLVNRCADALVREFDVSHRLAHVAAMHALAEVQTRHTPAYVDVQSSTSHVINVVDVKTNRAFAFTASELIRIADLHHGREREPAMRAACGRVAHL